MFGRKKDRVETAVLFVTLDTVRRYAPQGLTTTPEGGVSLDGTAIVRSLFPPVSAADVEEWARAGRLAFSLPVSGRPWPRSIDDAVQAVAQGMPASELKRLTFYTIQAAAADSSDKAWLVIAGQLANPPAAATIQEFR